MKLSVFLTLLFFSYLVSSAQNQISFNGSFEKLDATHKPSGWGFPTICNLDSGEKKVGKYSLAINSRADGAGFVSASYVIPKAYNGSNIELKGYLKTQDVSNGFAGLWLRIDGYEGEGSLAFDNMQSQGLKGTNDWKEYSIKLPYDDEHAAQIVLGGLIVGKGKIWMDGLTLYIDGKPIEQAVPKTIKILKAQQDTAFSKLSGIDNISLNKQQVVNLKYLGEVWGVVKYHHPLVAKGEFNMDAELFRVLPEVLKAKNNTELSAAIEKWVDKFGEPDTTKKRTVFSDKDVFQKPAYGSIFNSSVFSLSLIEKLKNIVSSPHIGANYYIELTPGVGNPIFKHELPYLGLRYADAGMRLLSLYRYWNMIEYFFPYKHLIGEDWEKILTEFIPEFIQAKNNQEYLLASLKLISCIHDTHANIWSSHAGLEDFRGKFALPIQAKFIENKLVVTGYYTDSLGVKDIFKVGDIITHIGGTRVENLIQKYLPLTAASNYPTQLRDMPRNYLLRSNKETVLVEIMREGRTKTVNAPTLINGKLNRQIDYDPDPKAPAFKVLDGGVGYLFPGRYKNKDLPQIKKAFETTKGIIIDMRCYPSDFMPFTFVPYVKTGNSPFVKFAFGNIAQPGLFTVSKPLTNAGTGEYKGKVVVIVNEQTQSQAEYTTMAFQSSANVKVLGSTTAGADGNVSGIILPGGINTMISGLGILYPDNTETQRKGVKIDYEMSPTVAGVLAGRDELLDKAIQIVLGK